MNKETRILALGLLTLLTTGARSENGLHLQGQASGWACYSSDASLPVWFGARYIPQLNVQQHLGDRLIDFEASANLTGSVSVAPFDSSSGRGRIKPYRIWARYSTPQLEVRLGLQKINFGSAALLRPLMWFDQVDPRDPLQLTDGVWGLLGRYYFINNANIWLWLLRPSGQPKSWEIIKTNRHFPEWGGRMQYPVSRGEMGLSGHVRVADARDLGKEFTSCSQVRESRIGLDGKWDWVIGLWFEGAWIHSSRSSGLYVNQRLFSAGADYTFGLGNGLNVLAEHLWIVMANSDLLGNQSASFSGLSLSYPISAFDQISAILYADWTNDAVYRFAAYRRQYAGFALNLMAFWNPTTFVLPSQSGQAAPFTGKGIQIMLIYHH